MFEKTKTSYDCFPDEEIKERDKKIRRPGSVVKVCVDKRWIRLEFHDSVLILLILENQILNVWDNGNNVIYTRNCEKVDRISFDIFKSNLDANMVLMISGLYQDLIAGKAGEDMAERVFYEVIKDGRILKFIEKYFPIWVCTLRDLGKDCACHIK